MRTLLTVAVAATATLALAAGAVAAQNDAEATLIAKASPADAGTKKKPKNLKVGFDLKVDKPGTTVEVIELLLPKGTKISGKGFKSCDAEDLLAVGVTGCPSSSKAGPKGIANALLEGEHPAPLNFDIYPYVEDSNTLLFYLVQQGGQLQSVLKGEITSKGRKMSIRIPQELRQPVPGTDATLIGIDQTFSNKRKRNYIVSSTSCPKGGWKFGGNLKFAIRADGTPPPADEKRTHTVKCKK